MKRLFKGALLICLATLMAACDEDATLQQEANGDKIQISLLFSIGNSPLSIGGPMTGTKGSGEDLFDAIYQGIVSGEIIASYELTFKNINTGASTSISGKWTDNKTISLEKGTYTIYGISTAIGKGIYKDCSLSYQDEVTITPETRSITIKAQYDCSLLIVNDDSVDKILYYASQNDSTYFSQYQNLTYAFVKSAEDFTQGNNAYLKVYFKNGRSSIVDLGQINIQKGKYYLLENLNNYADAGLVLDIDKMENGDDNEKDYNAAAFFPATYADKTVAAWYSWTEKDKDKTKTEAIFLFTDQTFVVTKIKVYSKEDGRSPVREIEAVGTYQIIEGDFIYGKAAVVIADGGTMTVDIKDGKLTTEMGDEVFIKQDNSKVPVPSDPTENSNQSGGEYEHPIEFSISNSKSTRAYISTNSDVATNGGFKVWGFKNVSSSSDWTTVFDGTTVSSSDYGSTWTYTPLRYWDANAQYKFYAAAPAQNANGTITFADNTICVNNVHYAKKSDSDVECKVQRGVYTAYGSSHNRVDFTFSHIMANLVVEMKKDALFENVEVKLNSLKIEGWNGGNGNFRLNPESSSNADIVEWTIPEYSNGVMEMVDENGVILSVNEKVIGDYLMIPQSIDDNCILKMQYTISYLGVDEIFNYDLNMNLLYQTLNTGSKNILTFTIGPDVITFDANCMTWEDENGYELTVY